MKKKRFVVDEAGKFCADERKFCNGKCVYNQILGFAYSVDQIVEVLNNDDYYDRVMDLMQNKIWYMQGMFHRTGLKKYKYMENTLMELRDELYEPGSYGEKYGKVLNKWFKESLKHNKNGD